jgi:DNA-binding MarR family transcriptional regulator
MLKNERDIYSLMSAYTEEDRKIALAVWRFLEADSKPTTAKTIASKLNLAIYAVHTAIDRLIDRGCVEIVDSASGRATYAAILPKQ